MRSGRGGEGLGLARSLRQQVGEAEPHRDRDHLRGRGAVHQPQQHGARIVHLYRSYSARMPPARAAAPQRAASSATKAVIAARSRSRLGAPPMPARNRA